MENARLSIDVCITVGVHVGSCAPSPYISAPPKMYILIAHNRQYTVYNTTTRTNQHDMTLYAYNISGSAPVALFITRCLLGILQACKVLLILSFYMHPPV